ncbi:MAG TPA: glycosyltransferase [Ignavibacteria bacterium]|nr:glycosyltransferase [Ignavibacteria bacterium]
MITENRKRVNGVTVLMAAYNDSKYIGNAIRSILNQTFRNFEFLIIDDGSTDGTENVIKSFSDKRINYKKISHRGLAAALNYGLSISSCEWIARIDADDLNSKERLEKQLNFLNENKKTDVLSGWSVYFNEENEILFQLKTPVTDKKIKEFLNLHNPVNHSSVMFNREKILREGGYNEKFGTYEDFELWFRLKDKLHFRILPETLVYTRLRKNSMTGKGSKAKIYRLLFENAESKFNQSVSVKEKKYWSNVLFWVEYFYGSKDRSRKYFTEDITLKKSIAYLNTFLPDNGFEKLAELRIRQRLSSGIRFRKEFKDELKKLIN